MSDNIVMSFRHLCTISLDGASRTIYIKYSCYMSPFSRYREYDDLAELQVREDMVDYHLAHQSGTVPHYSRLQEKEAKNVVRLYVHHVRNMDRDLFLHYWMGHHYYRCVP